MNIVIKSIALVSLHLMLLTTVFAQEQASDPSRINLRTADEKTLCRLPGIGPKRAQAIIALRSQRPFTRLEDLLRVKGIGRNILREIRPLVELPGESTRMAPSRVQEKRGGPID